MNILEQIVEKKKEQLPKIQSMAAQLKKRTRPFYSLKKNINENTNLSVIAEIKRGSPSLGLFAPDLDIEAQALSYQTYGASAISVLTDENFYGSYTDLEMIAKQIQLPVLAKDFIIDVSQIAVAHAAGADVILLIAAILTPEKISELAEAAMQKGLEVILELHDIDEIPLDSIPPGVILGLNNRNLKTFEVSIHNGISQIQRLKDIGVPVIAESGIHTLDQAQLLSEAGFSGMLIGESLIRSGNTGNLLADFARIPRR